ncbi:ABC transporter substrate-binding protein [Sediminitomix flava]|uniref:ABC-type branched-subunit amino acid transport system substrate-binding protein n=1 Tax=Sediminitomix flava TaxID=379075 RepID=A0A315Z868_SEDFL|nr:ABC transporter substrate-binding protein [Sediminitomix flava]PWJ40858.1 ABC-type branched-subunit amino acid transport system substrate-binding protein [Sediminitomix flava]
MRIFLFVLFGLLAFGGQAQSLKQQKEQFLYAQDLVKSEKYEQAKVVLKPIKNAGALAPYASYLFAFSDYKLDNLSAAEQELKALSQRSPNWSDMDEANFLRANILMEQGKTDLAFAVFDRIKSGSFRTDVYASKVPYLADLDEDHLKSLHERYPEDKAVGQILLAKIASKPSYQIDQALFNELNDSFGGDDKNIYRELINKKSVKKDSYNVAALLPFFSSNTDPNSFSNKREFVYKIYEGMNIAAEWLKAEGVDINLLAFDTQRDVRKVEDLVSQKSFENIDMIVGPLYGDIVPVVKEYSEQAEKVMVNPISTSNVLTDSSNYSYLLFSDPDTQAKSLVNYLQSKGDSSVAYIAYGSDAADKELAYAYKKHAEEAGVEVQMIAKFVDFQDMQKSFDLLNTTYDSAELAEDDQVLESISDLRKRQKGELPELVLAEGQSVVMYDDRPAHVFIAAKKERVASSILSALRSVQANAPIYTTSKWLDFKYLAYDQMEAARVHFLYPEFNDLDGNATVNKFVRDYMAKYNVPPSFHAFAGFETIYYFGKMLNKYGTRFGQEIAMDGVRRGALFPAHAYPDGETDNQYVPIVRFVDGKLEMINSISNFIDN